MKKVGTFFKNYIATIIIIAFLIFYYEQGSRSGRLDGYLFPPIREIGDSFATMWPVMLQNFRASLELLIPGLLLGLVIALAIGIPMGLSEKVRRALYPIVYAASMIPVILLSPFAVHAAPTLRSAAMFIVVWAALWATLFSSINGIMTIDKRYLDKATTLELHGFKRLVHVILPAALPSIAGGLVTSVRSAFLGLVFAEMYGTRVGLGYFVRYYSDLGYFEHVWSGFLCMAVFMIVFMQILEVGKNRLLRWTIN
ncbi:MAG: ABC transporter permease subunit [Oscillospiraceae bacterium]|nr:ABC transporter permease subunit [Oscillospiraceae bacterium]